MHETMHGRMARRGACMMLVMTSLFFCNTNPVALQWHKHHWCITSHSPLHSSVITTFWEDLLRFGDDDVPTSKCKNEDGSSRCGIVIFSVSTAETNASQCGRSPTSWDRREPETWHFCHELYAMVMSCWFDFPQTNATPLSTYCNQPSVDKKRAVLNLHSKNCSQNGLTQAKLSTV